jgi:hypothetical protein
VVRCDQVGCRHLRKTVEVGRYLCIYDDITLLCHPDKEGYWLKCNNYKYRKPDDPLTSETPVGPDGLYPGQIKG